VLEQLPEAENYLLPVGGGGLSAGFSVYAQHKNPNARIIGCQHMHSAGLKESLEKGYAVTKLPPVDTVAGGLEGGIGEKCFEVLKDRISDVLLCSEEEIIEGFRWMLQNHQYLIEPSAAVVIASCLFKKVKNLKGPTVIVISGRNVSYDTIKKLM
jgi:threonine dehydratase